MVPNLLLFLGTIIKDLVVKTRLIVKAQCKYSTNFFYFLKDIILIYKY